ncbi:MAG: NAD(P)/FAD-dependent oxidoreductase [Acetobacteraceae bacterium]|nr:NAD(P)/FAD-dependent oxidoreductase [Acetobacteraceae bacterium]
MTTQEARAADRLHRIVIVGGGAAGSELATRLGDKLGKRRRADITLIDCGRTHIWKPMLHAVAAGSMNSGAHELNYMAQAHWHHFRFQYGAMTGIDREKKCVKLAATHDAEGREITSARAIPYDTLVIAIGSVTNDFGTPGAAQYAVPLETLEQAIRFNHRLVNACVRAHAQEAPVQAGQLHVAVIGAGATGTELAAELHKTARQVISFGLEKIDVERDVKIILIEAASRVLPALPERISETTLALLGKLGVEVRTSARVSEVRADGVCLADGTFIPSELVVWSAGVKAPEVLKTLGLETNRINQIVVTPTLQSVTDPDIFAIGDAAAAPRPGHDAPVPPRAQAAHQMASHLYKELPKHLAGRPMKPFVYRDFGSLVSLGEYSTVGSLMGFLVGKSMFIEGYFARLMYRSLHKMHEMALHGTVKTALSTLSRRISHGAEPEVKLH